jgi:hypothetical protein
MDYVKDLELINIVEAKNNEESIKVSLNNQQAGIQKICV